jgi:glutamine cyclotransferase
MLGKLVDREEVGGGKGLARRDGLQSESLSLAGICRARTKAIRNGKILAHRMIALETSYREGSVRFPEYLCILMSRICEGNHLIYQNEKCLSEFKFPLVRALVRNSLLIERKGRLLHSQGSS